VNVQTEREEVFDGRFEECVDHLASRLTELGPKGTRKSTRVKEPIAEFCGVSVDTVTDWLVRRSYRPHGLKLIKLVCYLDLIGYRVREMARMKPPALRGLVELIGYDVLSVEAAVEQLHYSSPSQLYRVLWGRNKPTKDREKTMLDLWLAQKGQLEEKKRIAREHLAFLAEPADTAPSPTQKAVIHQMEALLVLLEEGGEPLGMDMIRRAGQTVHKLSAHLSDLSLKLYSEEGGADER